MGWVSGQLALIAADAGTIRDVIVGSADSMQRSIQGLDWSGQAHHAATGRGDREPSQQRAVATAYDILATALHDAESDTGWAIDRIRDMVHGLPATWNVSEQFTVTAPHGAAAAEVNEAANDTARLQNLADHLGQAMDKWAKKIAEALDEIGCLAPVSAEKCVVNPADRFTAQQAAADLAALGNGTADAQTLARLHVAADLTQDEKDALADGRGIDIPQFDYLQALAKNMGGMSVADIADLGSKLPGDGHDQVQAAIANDFRIVSDPQVHAAGLDGRQTDVVGAMDRLPGSVRSALQSSPVRSIPFGSHDVNNWNDLRALNTVMSRGDKSIQGSDINRAMIKQGAELAGAAKPDSYFDVGPDNVGKVANGLLDNASGDHAAVHDAVIADPNAAVGSAARDAADRMAVTCDHGGRYFGSQHVRDILEQPWTPEQHGAEHMFDWVGANAVSTADHPVSDHQLRLAGESADGLAHVLIANHDTLAGNMPSNNRQSLGQVNPLLTQSVGEALKPYIANFAGANDPGIAHNPYTHPLATAGSSRPSNYPDSVRPYTPGDLSNLFSVIDSDPKEAASFNAPGEQVAGQLDYLAGAGIGPAGTRSAQLADAMQIGLTDELDTLTGNEHQSILDNATAAYDHQQENADIVTGVVNGAGIFGPEGGLVSTAAWIVDPVYKGDLAAPDTYAIDHAPSQWTEKLAPVIEGGVDDAHTGTSAPQWLQQVNIVNGYHSVNPDALDVMNSHRDHYGHSYEFFTPDGKPNIPVIAQNQDTFDAAFQAVVPSGIRTNYDEDRSKGFADSRIHNLDSEEEPR